MRLLDHLVYGVTDLEKAMADFASLTGVMPVLGGYHPTQGTKNALVGLGDRCYLELLAIDDNNRDIAPPRWMGIDLVSENKLTRWGLHSTNLQKDAQLLAAYAPPLGQVTGGQRQMANGQLLKWELTLPGPHPEVELIPFCIDWSQSELHPADKLGRECSLIRIELFHPEPNHLRPTLAKLGVVIDVIKADEAAIRATLNTPNGEVMI